MSLHQSVILSKLLPESRDLYKSTEPTTSLLAFVGSTNIVFAYQPRVPCKEVALPLQSLEGVMLAFIFVQVNPEFVLLQTSPPLLKTEAYTTPGEL